MLLWCIVHSVFASCLRVCVCGGFFLFFRRYIFNWLHLATGSIAQVLAGKEHPCHYGIDKNNEMK